MKITVIKYFSTFSGYGGDGHAMKLLGIKGECVGFSEIDKNAIKCHEQNLEGKNFGDITKLSGDELPDFDLLTGGFPCQAFSVAGKGLGEKDSRGVLFNDMIRVAEKKKPKMMLLENVRGLFTKRHEKTFKKILSELDRIGYNVKYELRSAVDDNVPHKRVRIWFVCFRKDLNIRLFKFPRKLELTKNPHDLIENGFIDKDSIYRLSANYFKGNNLKGYLEKKKRQIVFADRIIVPNATKLGYKFAKIGDFVTMDCPTSKTNRGRVQREAIQTLTTSCNVSIVEKDGERGIYFRMLTAKECFRFQGFYNDQINLDGISESQKKKLAGNGWNIITASRIIKNMLDAICMNPVGGKDNEISKSFNL